MALKPAGVFVTGETNGRDMLLSAQTPVKHMRAPPPAAALSAARHLSDPRPSAVRTLSGLAGRAASRALPLPLAALSAGLPAALGGGRVDIARRSRDVWTGAEGSRGSDAGEAARVAPAVPSMSLGGHGEFLGLPFPTGVGGLFINTRPALVVVEPVFCNNPDLFPVMYSISSFGHVLSEQRSDIDCPGLIYQVWVRYRREKKRILHYI